VPPAFPQRADVRALAVGEQHGEQGDVGQCGDQRVVGADLHEAEPALSDQCTGQQEQQRGRQHRPRRDTGERHADEQDDAERQYERHGKSVLESLPPSAPDEGPTRLPGTPGVKMPQKSARGKPNVYRAAGADMRARQDFRKDPHLPAAGNRLELVPMPGTACADTDLPGNQLAVKTVHPA
jgi:hypothetical protein